MSRNPTEQRAPPSVSLRGSTGTPPLALGCRSRPAGEERWLLIRFPGGCDHSEEKEATRDRMYRTPAWLLALGPSSTPPRTGPRKGRKEAITVRVRVIIRPPR
jgi:hypothetical protein